MSVSSWSWDDSSMSPTCFSSGSVVRQQTRCSIEWPLTRLPDRFSGRGPRSPLGHEERFLPSRLSAGFLLTKETIAGRRRNGRNAPIADLPALAERR